MTDATHDRGTGGKFAGGWEKFGLGAVVVVALFFYVTYAVKYFSWDAEVYSPYFWAKRHGLILHISGATLALLIGPFQLWSGLHRLRMNIHRVTGKLYLAGLAVGSAGALVMLPSATEFGVHYAIGLFGLVVAWMITGGMATYAIAKRNFDQHKEWMIRSYVVTFAFVTFRLVVDYIPHAGLGMTQVDFSALMAWTSWVVPLMITEAIMQGRKI